MANLKLLAAELSPKKHVPKQTIRHKWYRPPVDSGLIQGQIYNPAREISITPIKLQLGVP